MKDRISLKRFPRVFFHRYARVWMSVLLILSDSVSLLFAGGFSVLLRATFGEGLSEYQGYITLAPVIFIFIVIYYMNNLYPAIGLGFVSELQRLTLSTSIVFPLLATITFWAQTSIFYSRLIFSFFWIFALIIVPTGRWITRRLAHSLQVWGEPVAIIGFGSQGKDIYSYLINRPELGLLPSVIFDGRQATSSSYNIPILHIDTLIQDKNLLAKANIHSAILVASEISNHLLSKFLNERQFEIRHLVQILTYQGIGGSAVIPHDFQGLLGLEVECNLLNPLQQNFKRLLDVLLIIFASPILLPLFALIGILIIVDTQGGIFYGHKRIGLGGKEFYVWKFRTMVEDADQVLEKHLQDNPQYSQEWKSHGKLKNDPRITRAGKLLRKTSLDELPQIWNIFKGEMSLVGPRPIIQSEIEKYQKNFSLYIQVKPGLTGLWQVSGRSDLTYNHRVRLDEYYIRRWSIWMDLYILLRTFPVVIKRAGAY